MSARTLAIHFPDGETEYWLTERVYEQGETLVHRDRQWIVTDVPPAIHPHEAHTNMTVREVDATEAAQEASEGLTG